MELYNGLCVRYCNTNCFYLQHSNICEVCGRVIKALDPNPRGPGLDSRSPIYV